MNIASISDPHIHDDRQLDLVSALCKEVYRVDPDVLVLNGDIADPWKAPWKTIRGTQSWFLLRELCADREQARQKTYWITANHDSNAEVGDLPGVILRKKLTIDGIEFRHGWEWDLSWNIIHRPIFWLADHFPGLMIPVHNLFRKGKTYEGQTKEEFGIWAEAVHVRARAWASRHGKRVVLGHSHHVVLDDFIANSGSIEDRKYVLIEDGKISLRGF